MIFENPLCAAGVQIPDFVDATIKLPWFLQLNHCYKFCIACIDLVCSVILMEASVLMCCMVSNNILDLEYNPKNMIKKAG